MYATTGIARKKSDEFWKKRFANKYKFSGLDMTKTILLFRIGVYRYENLNIWIIGKNSMKHHYLRRNDFFSHLNMNDISDAGYRHEKTVFADFEIKHLGQYHDLYVQSMYYY